VAAPWETYSLAKANPIPAVEPPPVMKIVLGFAWRGLGPVLEEKQRTKRRAITRPMRNRIKQRPMNHEAWNPIKQMKIPSRMAWIAVGWVSSECMFGY